MEQKEVSTKDRILQESMKLFSVQGYDAVSVRMIAAAVGIRDSALYKHFTNKQAIFDAIVEMSRQRFWDKYKQMKVQMNSELDFVEMCLRMFHFQTQDEWIVRFRQMLVIEQFKNPKAAQTYKELFIDMPVDNQERIFQKLIEVGIMRDNNARVMAMELYAPFFLYHTIQYKVEGLEEDLRQHIINFKETYFIEQ